MTPRRSLIMGIALLLGAVTATVAVGTVGGGRQPVADVELAGFFYQAKWQGTLSITISPGSQNPTGERHPAGHVP